MSLSLDPVPPKDAVAAFRARGGRLQESFDWEELYGRVHGEMFTVAKSAGFDILKDIHAAMLAAIEQGETLRDFAVRLKPVLQEKGWWGAKEVADPETGEIRRVQLGSDRRLRTIFETNMRVSYAAGHWARFERGKKLRPWLRYVAVLDGRTRDAHRHLHDTCLRVDDPAWDTWAPPNGWGCRCTLQSLSDRDVARLGDRLKTTPPAAKMRRWRNERTGEEKAIPEGIDPGWDYNPGRAGARAAAVADKAVQSQTAFERAMTGTPVLPPATKPIDPEQAGEALATRMVETLYRGQRLDAKRRTMTAVIAEAGPGYGRLTPDQALALRWYTSPEGKVLNAALRGKETTEEQEIQRGALAAALARLPSHRGPTMRGYWADADETIAKHAPGAIVMYEAFLSSSAVAPFPGNVQVSILSVDGRLLGALSSKPGQAEVLFPPQTPFLVLSVDRQGDEVQIMLEEIGKDRVSTQQQRTAANLTPEQRAFVEQVRAMPRPTTFQTDPEFAARVASAGQPVTVG